MVTVLSAKNSSSLLLGHCQIPQTQYSAFDVAADPGLLALVTSGQKTSYRPTQELPPFQPRDSLSTCAPRGASLPFPQSSTFWLTELTVGKINKSYPGNKGRKGALSRRHSRYKGPVVGGSREHTRHREGGAAGMGVKKMGL